MPPTDEVVGFLEGNWLVLLLGALLAFFAYRLVRPVVRRIAERVIAGRAKEGMDEAELNELRKRVATIEELFAKLLKTLVIVVVVVVILTVLDLTSVVKTSGSKGFHIVVPLDAKAEFGAVHEFAHKIGTVLVSRDPKRLTQEFSKADRGGRILIDTGRNGYSATFAAPYTVRAKRGAPISAPCTWEEVKSGEVAPQTFTIKTIADRIERVGDLWADMRKHRYSLRSKTTRIDAEASTRRSS